MNRLLSTFVLAGALAHSNIAGAITINTTIRTNMPTSLASYTANGGQYVFYVDAWGGTNVLENTSGTWTQVALFSASDQYNCAPGTTLVAFFDGSVGHLYCNGADKHLLQFAGNPPTAPTDITAVTGSPTIWGHPNNYVTCGLFCRLLPGLASPPTLSGYTGNGALHVFYPADDAALHESYYDTSWHDRAIVPASSPAHPSQFYTAGGQGVSALWDGSIGHVYYIGDDTSYYQLYYYNNTWFSTTLATGANVPFSFLASASPGTGEQWVTGATAGATIAYDDTSSAGWQETGTAEANLTAESPSLSYSVGGVVQYFYVGSNQHVYSGRSGWDLTAMTGAPNASNDLNLPTPPSGIPYIGLSKLTGYYDGCRHVFYVATTGHVHEMYSCNATTWTDRDLMPSAQMPAAY